ESRLEQAERDMGGRKLRVEADRLAAIGKSRLDGGRIVVHQEFEPIGFAESGVAQSEAGSLSDGGIELGDGQSRVAGLVVALQVAKGLEIGLVGSGSDRSAIGGPDALGADLHHGSQAKDGLILQSGEVARWIVDLRRTDLAQALRVDKNHGER